MNRASMLRMVMVGIMLVSVFASQTHAVSARPHYPKPAVNGRSWVDKRVDALSDTALATLSPQALVDADRAHVAESLVLLRRPLFFVWAFAQILSLFLFWRTGFAAKVRDYLADRVANVHLLRALFTMFFTGLVSLIVLPCSLINFHLARMVGVSFEPLLDFLHDFAIATALNMLLAAVIIMTGLALVNRVRIWYLYAIGILVGFGLLALFLTPIAIDPLYRTITLISPQSTVGQHLYDIERKVGIGYVPIYLTNLSRTVEVGNANVEGIGPTRRVLVGDTLLNTATYKEVSFVIAHEFGHLVNQDPLDLTLIADLLTILAIAGALLTAERIAVRGDDDPLSRLTLIAALAGLYSLLVFPIGNTYSRTVEARADRFGLSITHNGPEAARMFVRFADEGFSPVCPPRIVRLYFYDHPPLGSRITAATGRPDACE